MESHQNNIKQTSLHLSIADKEVTENCPRELVSRFMKGNTSYLHSMHFVEERKLLKLNPTKCLHLLTFFFFFLKGWNFSYTSHWLNCPILIEACQDNHVFLQLNDAIVLTNQDFVLHKQMHAHYTTFLKSLIPISLFTQFVY